MEKPLRDSGELFLWPILGYAVALLMLELGSQPTIETSYLRLTCETVLALDPLGWFAPYLATLYGLYRGGRFPHDAPIVMFAGLVGCGVGFLTSAFIQSGTPPNNWTGRYTIPAWCLIGCLVGAVIVAYLDERRISPQPPDLDDRSPIDK